MRQTQHVIELFPCSRAATIDKAVEQVGCGEADVNREDGDGCEISPRRSTVGID